MKSLIEEIKNSIRPLLVKQMEANKELVLKYPEEKNKINQIDLSHIEDYLCDETGRVLIGKRTLASMHKTKLLEEKGYSKSLVSKFCNRPLKDLEIKLEKELEASLGKIDIAVKKKVKNHGDIVKVKNVFLDTYGNYVEGSWLLTDNKGITKTLSIESILAGGYNIQCVHLRTLYKYK